MRLSLFRQKSNNNSPQSTKEPKRRFSNILSSNRKASASEDHSQSYPTSSSPLTSNARPLGSPPVDTLPTPAAQTPPASQALGQLLSSDGPPLPTSEPGSSFLGARTRSHRGAPLSARSDGYFERSRQPKNGTSILEQRERGTTSRQSNASRYSTYAAHSSAGQYRNNSATAIDRERRSYPSTSVRSQSRNNRNTLEQISPPNGASQRYSTRIRSQPRSKQLYSDEDQISYGENSFSRSFNRERLSSPSAAAAIRNKRRAASSRRTSSQIWLDGVGDEKRSFSRSSELLAERSESRSSVRQWPDSSEPSRVSSQHLQPQPRSSIVSSSFETRPASSSADKSTSKRPTYLQDHQASDRSIESMDSEASLGLEEPTPEEETALASKELSRLPSFGSLQSDASAGTDPTTPKGNKRSRSASLHAKAQSTFDDGLSSLNTTPRAKGRPTMDPSDTVIAKHVRDIEVPPTVARKFTASQADTNANDKFFSSSPYRLQGANNFSVKEQNAKYDKLEKENFGLKLKIHFLYQTLGDRSEEGVSDLISKNAQLSADNVQLKKENQQLKRRVKELERQVDGRLGAASSIAPSHVEEDDVSSRVMEEELGYLQQRMQDLEFENVQLAGTNANRHLLDRLENERHQKEQAQRQVEDLRQLNIRLKSDRSPMPQLRSKTSARDIPDSTRPRSKIDTRDTDSFAGSGSTLVEHLRQQNEEHAGLLLAQGEMLKAHRREKEQLQQQIENLKLVQRRGGHTSPESIAGDSIFDRSVSRAQHRPASRASRITRDSQFSENERDHMEDVQAQLRDENAVLKMRVQDLRNEINELSDGAGNIRRLLEERDEAIEALKEADNNLEAQSGEVQQLEDLVLQREDDITNLEQALRAREGESEAFRTELKKISNEFDEVIEDSEGHQAAISSLREDISRANGELEVMEDRLRDLTVAKERLEVQQESYLSEIQFLREEQETDKITISDLQTALQGASSNPRGDDGLRYHEVESLQRTNTQSRDELRQLRGMLSQREAELKLCQEKLDEALAAVEEFSANFDGTRESYADDLKKLQGDVDRLTRDLDRSKEALAEKDRLLASHDTLLESGNNETRSLSELLTKERQGRKHDRNEFDRALHRAKSNPGAKVVELEMSRDEHRRRVNELERELDSQVQRRDKLLHTVWNGLSSISTTEGLADNQEPLASAKDVAEELPTITRRLPMTLDAIASHIASFRSRIQEVEHDISQDFETLSDALSERTTRLQNLETAVAARAAPSQPTQPTSSEKYTRLKDENKLLRRENRFLKQGSFSLPGLPPQQAQTDDEDPTFPSTYQPSSLTTTRENGASTTSSNTNTQAGTRTDPNAIQPPQVHQGPRAKEKSKRMSSALVPMRAYSDNSPNEAGAESTPSTVRHQPDLSSSSVTNLAAPVMPNGNLSDDGSHRSDASPSRPHASNSASHGASLDIPRRSSSANIYSAGNINEKTWLMRLEEMRRRMKMEREGRLLDRDAARKRLMEGEREREELKSQLRRERERGRLIGGGSQAGAGAGDDGVE